MGGSLWHAGQKELNTDRGAETFRMYGVPSSAMVCDASEIDLPISMQRAHSAQRSAIKTGAFGVGTGHRLDFWCCSPEAFDAPVKHLVFDGG